MNSSQTASTGASAGTIAPALSLRILQWILIAHLLLLTFQLPIRAMVWDTTFIRDVGVFAAGLFLIFTGGRRMRQGATGVSALDVFVGLYLAYGALLVPAAVLSGVPLVDALLQFRNHFLPFVLFVAARRAVALPADRARLISVFGLLALLLSGGVLLEWLARTGGMSAGALPWARYAAETSDRFVEGVVNSSGGNYVTLDTAPILGLFGWPHASVVPMLCAFALAYPFLVSGQLKEQMARQTLLARVPRIIRMLAPLWVLAAAFAFAVTMHLLTAALVLLILPWVVSRYLVARTFWVAIVVVAALLLIEPIRVELMFMVERKIIGSDFALSTLELILTPGDISYVLNQPIGRLLFGGMDVYSGQLQAVGSFENRTVFYAAAYGLIWLLLFGGLLGSAFVVAGRQVWSRFGGTQAQFFGIGCLGLLVVVGFDMFHYARLMTAPNTDMVAIALGSLSAQESARRVAAHARQRGLFRAAVADPLLLRRRPQPLHG